MNAQELKNKTKDEVFDFIRQRLSHSLEERDLKYVNEADFKKEHMRFRMSGERDIDVPLDIVHNQSVINKFADLGIYKGADFINTSFWKGSGMLYIGILGSGELNHCPIEEIEISGWGTVDIIYEILKKTILD